MKRNKAVGLFVAILMAGSFTVGRAVADDPSASDGPYVYKLARDLGSGMPFRIRLKHCAAQEDTLSDLRMVAYEPGQGFVTYRCVND